jgi:hypothetical protein
MEMCNTSGYPAAARTTVAADLSLNDTSTSDSRPSVHADITVCHSIDIASAAQEQHPSSSIDEQLSVVPKTTRQHVAHHQARTASKLGAQCILKH